MLISLYTCISDSLAFVLWLQQEGTLMGTAFGVCFGYWIGGSALFYSVSFMCNTHLTFLQMLSLSVSMSKAIKIQSIYLFTSFSGHRPAQRECARTGLRSHARCHLYPIPQPVKVCHTTGVYDPYSFRIVMWVLLRPTRTDQWKCCETGPKVFYPYPRRVESLTICRCHYKGSTFFSVI